MELKIDEDLKLAAEFMQQNIPANRLVSTANGLAGIAPMLWGHYDAEKILPLVLRAEPISGCDPQQDVKKTPDGRSLEGGFPKDESIDDFLADIYEARK